MAIDLQVLQDQQAMLKVLAAHDEELRNIKGVTALGIGLRIKDGQYTDEACILVVVEKKLPENLLETGQLVPASVEGVNIDVVEKGQPIPALKMVKRSEIKESLDNTALTGGEFITNDLLDGEGNIASGTLGAMVYVPDKYNPYTAILTCHHVLYVNGGQDGAKVFRPHVSATDVVANLTTGGVNDDDMADYALAKMAPGMTASNNVEEIGQLKGIAGDGYITLRQPVRKYGITTTLTNGIVTGIIVTPDRPWSAQHIIYFTVVFYDTEKGVTDPLKKFADSGDSGSVVVDAYNYVIGQVVAINDAPGHETNNYTYASYIPYISKQYKEIQIPLPSNNQVVQALTDAGQLNSYREQLQQSAFGRSVVEALVNNFAEGTQLVNTQRDCMLAWQRNKGFAFISMIQDINSSGTYYLQKEIDGIRFEDMIMNMAQVFIQQGSEQLATTLKQLAPQFADCVKASNTVEELIVAINKQ